MDGATLVSDLDTYLGLNGTIDVVRASLVLDLAIARCSAVLDPVPNSAKGVVLDVAQRAYTNPMGASSESVGPYQRAVPSIGVSLTSANRRELRQIGGRGGAYSVDPTPADAGVGLYSWNRNQTLLNGNPELEDWEE